MICETCSLYGAMDPSYDSTYWPNAVIWRGSLVSLFPEVPGISLGCSHWTEQQVAKERSVCWERKFKANLLLCSDWGKYLFALPSLNLMQTQIKVHSMMPGPEATTINQKAIKHICGNYFKYSWRIYILEMTMMFLFCTFLEWRRGEWSWWNSWRTGILNRGWEHFWRSETYR